jgi:transposase-like protein
MSNRRCTDGFKQEAVHQVTENVHSVPDVVKPLGVSTNSLYVWRRQFSKSPEQAAEARSEKEELARLRREPKRVTEERDILRKAATYFAKESG